jgi:hypothetical protein
MGFKDASGTQTNVDYNKVPDEYLSFHMKNVPRGNATAEAWLLPAYKAPGTKRVFCTRRRHQFDNYGNKGAFWFWNFDLTLIWLACLLAKKPVFALDLMRWVKLGALPFFNLERLLGDDLSNRNTYFHAGKTGGSTKNVNALRMALRTYASVNMERVTFIGNPGSFLFEPHCLPSLVELENGVKRLGKCFDCFVDAEKRRDIPFDKSDMHLWQSRFREINSMHRRIASVKLPALQIFRRMCSGLGLFVLNMDLSALANKLYLRCSLERAGSSLAGGRNSRRGIQGGGEGIRGRAN